MLNIKQLAGSVVLAVACSTAGAGMHQICFEGPVESRSGTWYPTGIFGCSTDGAGSCTITPDSATPGFMSTNSPLWQNVDTSTGTFKYYTFSSVAGTFRARIDFFDSNSVNIGTRTCTINATGAYGSTSGAPTRNSVMTGFTTDAS